MSEEEYADVHRRFVLSFSFQGLVYPSSEFPSHATLVISLLEGDVQTQLSKSELKGASAQISFAQAAEAEFAFRSDRRICTELYLHDDSGVFGEQNMYTKVVLPFATIIISSGQKTTIPLTSCPGALNASGTLTISHEMIEPSPPSLGLRLSATDLEKMDFGISSDPYVVVSKYEEGKGFVKIYETEFIKCELNPEWKPFILKGSEFSASQSDIRLKFDCYDWNQRLDHELIGTAEVNWNMLNQEVSISLRNPKHSQSRKYKHSGILRITPIQAYPRNRFLDFIMDGYEINQIFSVDFTGSNGSSKNETSLHYIRSDGKPNDYEFALETIGGILAPYDADQSFPVYGFGGISSGSTVSHFFPLNGRRSAEVKGIDGVLSAYREAARRVTFSDPTCFAPTIDHCIHCAQKAVDKGKKKYFILMILTDGDVTDIRNTIDAVVAASQLPISIIIVGFVIFIHPFIFAGFIKSCVK
eukprot:TRINITY_DN7404_c0_g1_i1.p1 TRINITY_DN7404_c0_g1~~TRINITY_DN7404_c0_g1_i1.p1  ORF type:complete len:472 (+),score=89.01 TRINITY_DN7404_c0_g1_i1:49-1464(+)